MQYRREIDGLRSIAVLPVILFHAGSTLFSGGYVGVDIFFVISGYLITSIISEEINANNFSILKFYERRARRILPALGFVLIASTVMAYIYMPSNLLAMYSQSLVAVMTFSSNIFFYLTSGYFANASDELPLLHTWSLAVEEQYYVIFPLLLYWCRSISSGKIFALLLLISILSLSLSQYFASNNLINENFYLIFSRAWELLAGSLLALCKYDSSKKSLTTRNFMSIVGITLILFSIFAFDKDTPIPSIYALAPVLGTCIVILFATKDTHLGKLLSLQPIVFVGLLSYSLYLWHQPLFAFLRLKTLGEPNSTSFAFAIATTFILSFFSWKYVEAPFRNRNLISRDKIFTFSAILTILFILIGLAGHITKGFPKRFDQNFPTFEKSISFSPKRKECHTEGHNYLAPKNACRYFSDNPTWAVLGDSHAVEIAYSLSKKLNDKDLGLIHLTFSGCPPFITHTVKTPGCTDWTKEALELLTNDTNIKNVVIAYRHSWFLFGDQLDHYPDIPDEDPRSLFTNKNIFTNSDSAREAYWKDFESILLTLLDKNKNVFVIYPIPELPVDIRKGVMPISIFSKNTMIDLEKTTPLNYFVKRNKFILRKLDSLPFNNKSLTAIKPQEIFCNNEYCSAIINGESAYFDDDHTSMSGANLIIQSLTIE